MASSGVGVGADRIEGDVAEIEQAGEADHDVEAPAQHHVGQDQDRRGRSVSGSEKGMNGSTMMARTVGQHDRTAAPRAGRAALHRSVARCRQRHAVRDATRRPGRQRTSRARPTKIASATAANGRRPPAAADDRDGSPTTGGRPMPTKTGRAPKSDGAGDREHRQRGDQRERMRHDRLQASRRLRRAGGWLRLDACACAGRLSVARQLAWRVGGHRAQTFSISGLPSRPVGRKISTMTGW